MRIKAIWATVPVVLAGAISAVAFAQTPSGLGDLVGVRGSSLDNVMSQRGYDFARSQGAQYWWNGDKHVCAAVSIANGRVSRQPLLAQARVHTKVSRMRYARSWEKLRQTL